MLALNLPPVIGHRGAAGHAPENTLAGFRLAKELRCRWVEFDVRLTVDEALVVCHDDRLDRTTNGRGRISKLPLSAVQELDTGSWFAPRFAGERMPTLDEALSCCRELGLGANVEIKAEHGRGAVTARAVAAVLEKLKHASPPVLISSFLTDAVAEAAAQMPSVPRGMLWRKLPRSWRAAAEQLDCTTIHLGQADLDEITAAKVMSVGYPLLAYTVNDPQRARELFGWGVASVFSDIPGIIARAVADDLAGVRGRASL